MLIRYAFSIEEMKIDEMFHALEALVTKERYNKIQRYHFEKDKIRGLYAGVLLRYALKKHYGIEGDSLVFETNEYGKPELKGCKDIQFNLSHSGNWVVCAISDKAVGVDVEEIKEKNLDIAKRFYAPCEYEDLKAHNNKKERFFVYWTLKESYVKAEGKGMSIPFDSFSFFLTSNPDTKCKDSEYKISLQVENTPCSTYQFQTYHIAEDVMVSTCSRESISGRFQVLSQKELIEMLLDYL